jgi:tRNA (mo5U34)-methyltransferase
MSDLRTRAEPLDWYHTIELAPGVTSQGMFDCRPAVPRIPWPDLTGLRVLDVGTCDGFWAFELERRGAAEVVAIDLADPSERDLTVAMRNPHASFGGAKPTFQLAHEALGSKVDWRNCSIYDLNPEEFGKFDLVFIGSLLLHLRDPIKALMAVRSVTAGRVLSHDSISPMLSIVAPRTPAARLVGDREQQWWIPNRAGRLREFEAAGFRIVDTGGPTWVRQCNLRMRPRTVLRHPMSSVLLRLKGICSTWVLAEPAPE